MGISYNPQIVTNGLVLCLDAANVKSYPGTGTVWTDLSGSGNNASLVGSPSINSQGVTMTATGYVSLAGIYLNTSNLSTVSYSFFINFSWAINGYRTIFGVQEAAFTRVASLVLNTSSNRLQFDFRNGVNIERGIFDVDMSQYANIPTYVSYTFQSGTHRLYLNSNLVSTYNGTATVFPTWTSGSGFAIGENLDSSRLLTSGTFNSIQVYTRALSAAEIQQNFTALRGRYGI